MVKLKITRPDGTVVEAEGEAAEVAQLWLLPPDWYGWRWTWTTSAPAGGVALPLDNTLYK